MRKLININSKLICILSVFIMTITGCHQQQAQQPLPTTTAHINQYLNQPVPPAPNNTTPNTVTPPSYIYKHLSMRDPFASNHSAQVQNALIKYPLNKYFMVGSMNKDNKIWGIVRAPDGNVYPITVGSLIGIQRASVVKITSQQIAIQEITVDNGTTRTQLSSLMLTQVR